MLVGDRESQGGAQPQGDFLVLQVPAAQEVGVLAMELGVLVVVGVWGLQVLPENTQLHLGLPGTVPAGALLLSN